MYRVTLGLVESSMVIVGCKDDVNFDYERVPLGMSKAMSSTCRFPDRLHAEVRTSRRV